MKLLIALLLSVSATNAFACTEYGVVAAQTALNSINKTTDVGVSTYTDVLEAESDLLGKRLCIALESLNITENMDLFAQLGNNVDKRITIEQRRLDVGLGNNMRLKSLTSEKAGYSATCDDTLEYLKVRVKVGLTMPYQFDAAKNICANLK